MIKSLADVMDISSDAMLIEFEAFSCFKRELSALDNILHAAKNSNWTSTLCFERKNNPNGYFFIEKGRLICVRDVHKSKLEYFHFGNLIHFPVSIATTQRSINMDVSDLIQATKSVIVEAQKISPFLDLICLIPDSPLHRDILYKSGFRATGQCIDVDVIRSCGYGDLVAVECYTYIYQPKLNCKPINPFDHVTDDMSALRGFSNSQTKLSLEPTLNFWAQVSLYTTFSTYPIIQQFAEKLLDTFQIENPKSILLAPCGAGDFARFWPISNSNILISGIDIRADLIQLSLARLKNPNIDVLNYRICQLLDRIMKGKEKSEALDELKLIFDTGSIDCNHIAATESKASLFARAMDEILKNRAIPDWYFPIKQFASAGGCHASIRVDNLSDWLEENKQIVNRAVDVIGLNDAEIFSRNIESSGHNPNTYLEKIQFKPLRDDLTRNIMQKRSYDIVFCWEFIHVFHSADKCIPPALARFLDKLIDNVCEDGMIILTSIRQELDESEPPAEQKWAAKYLEEKGFSIQFENFEFDMDSTPFGERLNFLYPILAATLR